MKQLLNLNLLLFIVLSVWITPANSVAFCALRDPVTNIYKLFPDAQTYRSITHKIDQSTQKEVKKRVPFTLHQDELGQHTLYVAFKKKKPLGLIHARSEVGLWGLVEVAWAFDFKMNIVGFMFQRCREPACKLISSIPFQQFLKGKSNTELLDLLKVGTTGYPHAIENNKAAKELANIVIRSAIKTIQVTKISWSKELKHYLKKSSG
ncbi:MAG: hypothetical protein KAG26_07940 [Methylococcales bacterium]|nr:hypothetical protein [Methylococcales bacterium]